MSHLEGQLRERREAVAVVCMMCGRTVGRFHQGRVYVGSPGQTIGEGRKLRCGHCRGNVYLDLDPTSRSRRGPSIGNGDWASRHGRA